MNALRISSFSFGAVLAMLASSLSAQVGQPAQPATPGRTPIAPAEYRTALANARTLAKTNNAAAAEQALISLNHAKPGTSAWHQETANRLMQLASDLSREASQASARSLTAKAQEHLTQAISLARTPQERSQAHSTLGFIHERYNGNLPAAIASYKSAVEAMPKNNSAQEALQRLQLTDKHQQNRSASANR